MANEKAKLEQNQDEKPMTFLSMVMLTGFVGGILWSGLGYLAYVFNFTEIRPNVVLEPWALGDWKNGWLGTVISIIVLGAVSIVVALIYYAALRKMNKLWVGIAYGLAIFMLIFLVLHPIFPSIDPINKLERNTLITSICFFILYGTFIGYSISYEEQEQTQRQENEKEVPS
ncbi:YqhR family membrane protein [Cytobacillus sp. FJAT-54145]|uniref:YqhR family membrane protein n=1 Tax=Cytobacillus spartinae TaxID=3299023 RepID=A0ABW6KE41_9BACI